MWPSLPREIYDQQGLTWAEVSPAASYLQPGQKQLRDQLSAGAPSGPQGDGVQPFFLMWSLHPMADHSIFDMLMELCPALKYTNAEKKTLQLAKLLRPRWFQIANHFFISERKNKFKHSLKAISGTDFGWTCWLTDTKGYKRQIITGK